MSSITESPYKKSVDSPSRQLLWELAQLHLNDRTSFYTKLEQDAREREEQHRAALAAAAAEHDRIRQRAEIERERLQIQMEEEMARRDARQRKLLDTQRRLAAEKALKAEQKELAKAQALEEENRKIAEVAKAKIEAQRKAQEAQAEIDAAKRIQAEQENAAKEAARRAIQDAQRRKSEEAAKAATQATQQPVSAAPTISTAPATARPQESSVHPQQRQPSTPLTQPLSKFGTAGDRVAPSIASLTGHLNPERIAEHKRYLQIHKNLKDLRKAVADEGKNNKPFKTAIGESRRTIRKCVGQITDVKGANVKPLQEIKTILTSAAQFSEPSIPVDRFIARLPENVPPGTTTNISVALVYLLNILSKSFLAQCTNDIAVSQHSADPLGILLISMFSDKAFQWRNSVPLVDILIAKFHASCPVLFGIYPPPAGSVELSTEAKRWLLGWRVQDKTLVSEQAHSDRMTGCAAGFAAISLRKFRSATKQNAYPPHNYWRALATLVNTPTDMLTPTLFLVLKNMIESQEKRIIEYFGHIGVVLMRQALIETPMRGAAKVDGPARRACMVLVDVIEKDRKIMLRQY